MLLPGSPSTGWSGGLEADGEGRRNGLGEKGMDAEDWNPQLLGGWDQGNCPNAGLSLGLFTSLSTRAVMFHRQTTEAEKSLGNLRTKPS